MRRILVGIVGMGVCMMIASAVLTLLSTKDDSQPVDWTAHGVDPLFTRWAADYAKHDTYTRTPIHLGFSRALSKRFTKAVGRVEINFETGQVTVAVENLDAPPEGSVHEVWLVDNIPGLHNSAAIDLGDDGDQIINLGVLPPNGSLARRVNTKKLAGFVVDMAAVMRRSPNQEPEYVIGGMQSIRFQINRQATLAEDHSSTLTGPLDYGWVSAALADPPPHEHGGGGNGDLIAQGELLFFNETFAGNGRTCGSCHPADNNLTIDIASIATLDPLDPLFVAEFDPINLPPFDPDFPSVPAFEDPVLMHARGLILENIFGFAVDGSGNLLEPPVFRVPPSLFNLEFTAPYGYSACCNDLQDFAMGAVIQHFPKTLNRIEGVDFVLPTAEQLQALEAFMLSNLSRADGNFKIKGPNNLFSTPEDPRGIDTTRPEVRGRDLFLSAGCKTCHKGTVLAGGNRDTGVENLPINDTLPTVDTGDGSGKFQTPQLFGLRKPHFFHNGPVGNTGVQFDNLRASVAFYDDVDGSAFKTSPTGEKVGAMSDQDIDDIARFLEAISVP